MDSNEIRMMEESQAKEKEIRRLRDLLEDACIVVRAETRGNKARQALGDEIKKALEDTL